jgi:hypothetical protein
MQLNSFSVAMNHTHQETLQCMIKRLHHAKTAHEITALRVELDDFEQRINTDATGLSRPCCI